MFFQSFSLYSRWNQTAGNLDAYIQLFVNENALDSVYLGNEGNLPGGPSAFPVTKESFNVKESTAGAPLISATMNGIDSALNPYF